MNLPSPSYPLFLPCRHLAHKTSPGCLLEVLLNYKSPPKLTEGSIQNWELALVQCLGQVLLAELSNQLQVWLMVEIRSRTAEMMSWGSNTRVQAMVTRP